MTDWDERYSSGEQTVKEPQPLLVGVIDGLEPGRALDLACGAGRHAIFLAKRGWQVTAVDASAAGIKLAKAEARKRRVKVDWRVADLESGEFEIETEGYDLVAVFYYLQRDLFARIRAGVRTGGIVVAAIHMVDQSPDMRPQNPAFLLRPGELREEFSGWEILHYYEGPPNEGGHHRYTAEIVAKKERK